MSDCFAEREIVESPKHQGEDEELVYSLTTTPWGSAPTDVTVTVKNDDTGAYVTADVTSGSASITGDVITLPKIGGLAAGVRYRVEIKFTANGQVFEPFFLIIGEE